MTTNTTRAVLAALLASVPLLARSAGPPIKRTGAAVDGGLNCTACHRTFAANSGSGRVRIDAVSYTPGVKQTITVTIEDPDARRWGFQLIARLRSDETKQAGTFTANENIRVRCDPDERDGPCNGALEFASHTLASTRPGTSGPGVFTVEWTPPDQDAGEISLYAAGNAANNDGTNNNDHIYTTESVVRPACNLTGAPSITAVTDAAAYNQVISSNTLISIFGAGFGSPAARFAASRSDLVAGKLPSEFGCVAVEVAGRRAPVLYVQADQINAQAPNLEGLSGQVEVRVIGNPGTAREVRGTPLRVPVDAYSPGIFAAAISPVRPGEVAVVYGTGFGFTEPVWQPGEFPARTAPLRDPFTVTIGGITLAPADVLYAGLATGLPGVYQFNLRIPATLAEGNAPLAIRVGSMQATATLPVRR